MLLSCSVILHEGFINKVNALYMENKMLHVQVITRQKNRGQKDLKNMKSDLFH